MILENLPWVAFGAALLATIMAGVERRPDGPLRPWTRILTISAAATAAATFLALVALFVRADVSYNYVFIYTHAELPLKYRIAGAWAGREGSLALWAMFAAIIGAFAAAKWSRNDGARWSLVFLSAITTAFLFAVARQDMFAPTSEFFLQQRPLGNGLNPTLQSDFFVIHPPMMFLAYALTNIPAASALGHLWAGTGSWSALAAPASRLNWLLYTLAMGLGGIWAYYTLGFGGYWAWDPVEVANLLPWLGLTLYLHAQLHNLKHGRYTVVGPFLAMLPLLLTIFSTISTRSGLWVSVHAFTDPTQTFNPDAAGRFIDILDVELGLRFHVGLFLALTGLFLALWVRRLSTHHWTGYGRMVAGAFAGFALLALAAPVSAYSLLAELGLRVGSVGIGMLAISLLAVFAAALPSFVRKQEGDTMKLDLPGLAYASVLILGMTLLILWLWHMIAANGWSTDFYEARLPLLAAPAMGAMTVFMALPWGKRQALTFTGISLAISLIVGYTAGAGIGLILMASVMTVVGLDRLRRAVMAPAPPRIQISRCLLVLGAMINVVFWLNPPTNLLGPIPGKWPIQLVGGLLAFIALHRSLEIAAGRPRGGAHALTALLGGYFVAPALAMYSWFSGRHHNNIVPFKPGRLHQAGLYLVHLAVAIALLGYGASTYLGEDERATFQEDAIVVGKEMALTPTTYETDERGATTYFVNLETDDGLLQVPLVWQQQAGAYYPLPATIRGWTQDLYVAVESICIQSPCNEPRNLVTSYEPTPQRPPAEVVEVTISAHVLPGLSLIWAALGFFVYGMVLLMKYGRAHSGIPLSKTNSTSIP